MARYPLIFSLLVVLMLAPGASAQQSLIPSPPDLSSKSYVLMDASSGRVLVERNRDERLAPASLTKMMTAYIADREMGEGRMTLDDEIRISETAWRTGGSRMFVQEGSRVRVQDLMRGVVIQSGNDASVALAEHISGGEGSFAEVMNQQAQQLGMHNSQFTNATGLPDPEMYSTAYDMALLAVAKVQDFPESYEMYKERYFTYNDIRQPNRNRLLWRDETVDGLKTGHTSDAGYCLVASAKRDGRRLVAVVMGASSDEARAREVQQLLNYGFRYFETHQLFSAGDKVMDSRVWKGKTPMVDLGLQDALHVSIPTGSRNQLQSVVDVDSVLEAPLKEGQEYGTLTISLNGEVLAERPLLALQTVEQGGLFKRLWDGLKLFFAQLFS
ncbi:MAG: D-alanyl-D-alanine carboxypeptidase [Halomonadaceae bacterium]|nr:MAG: D-alanyl-D-alanine carboxypeptidase [Halomonadaceae bacterium]